MSVVSPSKVNVIVKKNIHCQLLYIYLAHGEGQRRGQIQSKVELVKTIAKGVMHAVVMQHTALGMFRIRLVWVTILESCLMLYGSRHIFHQTAEGTDIRLEVHDGGLIPEAFKCPLCEHFNQQTL